MLAKLFDYNGNGEINENSSFYIEEDSCSFKLKNVEETNIIDYVMKTEKNFANQYIIVDKESFNIKSIVVDDKSMNRNLAINYNSYQKIENINFPKEISFEFLNLNSIINIGMKYQKVIFNKKLKYPFKINKKYIRVS